VVCQECFEDYVWKCDKCGCLIAYPEIEGGQGPGDTPLESVMWCQGCCLELVGSCDVCGANELVEDLTTVEENLLCERCAKGHGPTEKDDSPLLSQRNWQVVVREAISALPEELQSSIGVPPAEENSMRITVAGEPVGCDTDASDETSLTSVTICYFDSIDEAANASEEDELVWLSPTAESAGGPVIQMEGESSGSVRRYRIGCFSTCQFMRDIQFAILDECWGGGGMSLVCKDRNGRYVLEDGTQILPWQ
jgi:hypothetical protein